MSSYRVETAPNHTASHLFLLVAAVLLGALSAVGFSSFARTDVIADGTHRILGAGASVADLFAAGWAGTPGDIVAQDGSVVATGAGEPPVVLRGGIRLTPATRLIDGDVIETRAGRDRVESLVTTRVPIPIPVRYEGQGPLATLATPGAVGIEERVVGEYSGVVASSTVIMQALPMVVKRFSPKRSDKVVALTFDDGPWPVQTAAVLDILKAEGVHATFFVIGRQVYANPEIVRRIRAEGHLLGNHTQSHTELDRVGPAAVRQQIAEGQTAIQKVAGVKPTWFRPPGGHLSAAVGTETQRYGLRIAMWTVDPQDWRRPRGGPLVFELLRTIKPGSIVLLHDGGGDRSSTIGSIAPVIHELKKQGYTFVTLDALVR
ncbi:polysaccharide deacetylase family protein [bacterium]|nr:polysaccharide deacetylase family protein [bacterium]